MAVLVLLGLVLYRNGNLNGWLMPWLTPILYMQSVLIPRVFGLVPAASRFLVVLGMSLLVLTSAVALLARTTGRELVQLYRYPKDIAPWNQVVWILAPFSFSYVLLLAPMGTYDRIQDRYVLGLVPVAIVALLKLYQDVIAPRASTVSIVALVVFAVYSLGSVHDFYAESRALVSTIHMLQSSGVRRTDVLTASTRVGVASDGWVQVQGDGHMNDPRIQVPAGAYYPNTSNVRLPAECLPWIVPLAPAIVPRYFVVLSPMSCFAATRYPPVPYKAWLPPFHRALYVQQLAHGSK